MMPPIVAALSAVLLALGFSGTVFAQATGTPLYSVVRNMPENSWAKVNQNRFADAWVPAALRPLYMESSNPSPDKIIRSWSGFAWDSNRGDLILWGGGHANYSGNEVYRFRSSTLRWELAALPSEVDFLDWAVWTAIDGPDAAPASAHTYDNNTFLPVVDRFLTFGGAAYQTGGAWFRWTDASETAFRTTGPYLWDPNLADGGKVGGTTGSHVQRSGPNPGIVGGDMWENRDLYSAWDAWGPREHVNGCTQPTIENDRDAVYVAARHGGTAMQLFKWIVGPTPADDLVAHVGGYLGGANGQTSCGLWPERKLFLYTSTGSNPLYFWDLTAPGASNYNQAVDATDLQALVADLASRSRSITDCGLKFDPVRESFVLWCGDATLWRIAPPAVNARSGWTVARVTGTGTTPVTNIGSGILGKWKYAPDFDVFVGLMDPVDGSVWVYKPTGWVDPGHGQPPVNLPPATDPTVTPASGRVGTTFTFAAHASDVDGTIATVSWQFGDGIGLDGATVTRTFTQAGIYSAVVTVTDDDGATASATLLVTVTPNAPPTVTASASPTSVGIGQGVAFSAVASDGDGSVASIAWTFGDGSSGSGAGASHSYAAGGSYDATVTVTDDGGATATATVTVLVADLGVVLQQGSNGYAGAADTVLDRYAPTTSRNDATSLNINGSDYGPLLRFAIFQSEGGPVPDGATIVSAQLSVYKSTFYDPTYRLQRVLVPWTPAQATWNQRSTGVAWTTAGARGVDADIAAEVDAQVKAAWDPGWVTFDVGSRVAAWSTQAASGTLSNRGWRLSFASGNGNVTTMRSSEFATDTALRPKLSILYTGGGSGPANIPPTVSITQPAQGSVLPAGQPVAFAATASDDDGSVISVQFRVGTTVLGTSATPPYGASWTPTGAGSYTLTAIATDDDGAETSTSITVSATAPANAPPTVTASASPTSAEVGESVAFSAVASDGDGSIASIAWNFGDGSSGNGAGVAHAYAAAGSYTATVTVTDDDGATATATVTVTVIESGAGGPTVVLQQGNNGYAGAADTVLDRYSPTTSRNDATSLNINGSDYGPLLRFAIFQSEGGPVPNGATIVSAQLSVYKSTYYDPTYRLQRVLVPWTPAQATWNQRSTGVAWTTAGARGVDADIAAEVDAQVKAAWDPGWVTFDVGSRVAAWSTQAASGTLSNRGWRLSFASGNGNVTTMRSSEFATDTALRPKLSILYTGGGSGPANVPPTVTASATPTSAEVGQSVAFSAVAGDGDGSIASIAWNFGDGSSASGADASHSYAAGGRYDATVTVTDDDGATATATVTVMVTAPAGSSTTVALQQGSSGYAGASDTMLDRYAPTTVRNASSQFSVNGPDYGGLLRFAIFQSEGGPVPDAATIVSAQLSVYKSSYYDPTYRLQRVLVPWTPAQATWNQRSTGVAWATAGARGVDTDIAAEVDAEVRAGWNPGWVTFDVAGRVAAWSAQAAGGALSNRGWRLSFHKGNNNATTFRASEFPDEAQRPTLTIQYTTP